MKQGKKTGLFDIKTKLTNVWRRAEIRFINRQITNAENGYVYDYPKSPFYSGVALMDVPPFLQNVGRGSSAAQQRLQELHARLSEVKSRITDRGTSVSSHDVEL